jgi:hypothetical protein
LQKKCSIIGRGLAIQHFRKKSLRQSLLNLKIQKSFSDLLGNHGTVATGTVVDNDSDSPLPFECLANQMGKPRSVSDTTPAISASGENFWCSLSKAESLVL